MKKKWVGLFYFSTLLLGGAVMALVGCGGGGGPVTKPGSPTSTSPGVAFAALLPAGQLKASNVGNAQCVTCHTTESTELAATVHGAQNVACESCHGPGSNHVANETANSKETVNDILTYPNITNYAVCAQCHGVQTSEWANDTLHGHGIPVSSFVGLSGASSDVNGTTSGGCFRCHSGDFRTEYVDVPLANGETTTQIDANIGAMTQAQVTTAENSITATAECVTCHDPHKNTANLASGGQQFMLRRPTSNTTDTADIGPNVSVVTYTTYNQLCGSCHNTRAADPSDAGLVKSTSRTPVHNGPEMNMLAGVDGVQTVQVGPAPGTPSTLTPPRQNGSHYSANPDQCVTCHMPNASHTFLPSTDTSCQPCHTAADAQAQEVSENATTLQGLQELETRLNTWAASQTFAGNTSNLPTTYSWDYTGSISADVTSPTVDYVPTSADEAKIPIEIQRARYNYWYILKDASLGVHNVFYTAFLIQVASQNLDYLNIAPVGVPNVSVSQLKSYYKAKATQATDSSGSN